MSSSTHAPRCASRLCQQDCAPLAGPGPVLGLPWTHARRSSGLSRHRPLHGRVVMLDSARSPASIHGQVFRLLGQPPAGAARHCHTGPVQDGTPDLGEARQICGAGGAATGPASTGHRTASRCGLGAGPAPHLQVSATGPGIMRRLPGPTGFLARGWALMMEADARSGSAGAPERPRLLLLP